MDQVGGIQSAAIGPPTTAERRRGLAHIVSLVYRVLVPASPAILALGFGLELPTAPSFAQIRTIIQQTGVLVVLTARWRSLLVAATSLRKRRYQSAARGSIPFSCRESASSIQ